MPPHSYGVAFRDPAALERVLGAVSKHPRRAKQLGLGLAKSRRARRSCICTRLLPPGVSGCSHCGAFLCQGCDEITTANGGSVGFCLECLLVGRDADPRVAAE